MYQPLDKFPLPLLRSIFYYCALKDIKNIALSCKRFHSVLSDCFWKQFVPVLCPSELQSSSALFFQCHRRKITWEQAKELSGRWIACLDVKGHEIEKCHLLEQNTKTIFFCGLSIPYVC